MTRLNFKQNKYHATKTEVDGMMFDSRKEANRYCELKLLEKAGEISNIETQVPFLLIPRQNNPITGKMIEKPCGYIADFVYNDGKGNRIVEDTKGVRTDVYIIKRKLILRIENARAKSVQRRADALRRALEIAQEDKGYINTNES